MKVVLLLLLITVLPFVGGPKFASDLRSGMELVYTSDGNDLPPWLVEFVETGTPLMNDADCARMWIRRRPDQETVDENRFCVRGDTLFAWNETRSEWLSQRPVGRDMKLTLNRSDGSVVTYVTGSLSVESIGMYRLPVVETVVITVDSSGTPLRRLRERYAPTLATATGGRFEMPDSAALGGWRTAQTFELKEIRMPH